MKSLLTRYISVFLLQRFVLLGAGILLLATSIDFTNRGEEIIADADGNLVDVVKYTVYGLPDLFSNLISITALVATLFVFIGLMRHSELIAMLSSGISQSQLMIALLPAAIIIVGIHILLDNYFLPRSIFALRDLEMMEYAPDNLDQSSEIWTRKGSDIVRIQKLNLRNEKMAGVIIFHRDEIGHLISRISAPEATLGNKSIILKNVTKAEPGSEFLTYLDEFVYEIDININTMVALMGKPRNISWFETRELLKRPTLGNKPQFHYRIWLQKKITAPLGTLALIMLTVPLFQIFDRNANQFFVLMYGLTIGFLYVIIDSIVVALGEASLISPFWAAWTPTFLLIVLISTFAFERELVKVRSPRNNKAVSGQTK
jgi:lipopolysaccharide export system permease protein